MTQDNPMPAADADIYTGPAPTEAEKSSAALAHYLNFIWLVPLIIYLTKKDESAYVRFEAGKSLNFSLTCLIFSIIVCIWPIILIAQIVLGIMNGGKIKAGQSTKYPFAFKLVK